MVRKSKFGEFIDKFLSDGLTAAEAEKLRSELETDPEFRDELNLYRQVENAVQETDVMELREMLQQLDTPPGKSQPVSRARQYSFSLREELSSFSIMSQPVSIHDIQLFDEGLPVLHLVQHHIAEKETVHELYREQYDTVIDDILLSPADQMILDDVEEAMGEKDILDLRASLQDIAENTPAHPYQDDVIDRYLNGELDDAELDEFDQNMMVNTGLRNDLDLYREADLAIAETDVMELRASLQKIAETETSTSKKTNEIERYLHRELTDDELMAFETEMESNPDLVAEVNLHRELEAAMREHDVIGLRARLDTVNKEMIREKRKERSFIAKVPRKKLAAVSVAASLLLLLGIHGTISKSDLSGRSDLYEKHYTVYPGAGTSRTAEADVDEDINQALRHFNEQDYEESLHLFNEVLRRDADNPVGNFYAGMARQETGQYAEALVCYQQVMKTGDNLFVDQAEWYSGLCYLRLNDRKNAVRQFERIAGRQGFYREKAVAILKKTKRGK